MRHDSKSQFKKEICIRRSMGLFQLGTAVLSFLPGGKGRVCIFAGGVGLSCQLQGQRYGSVQRLEKCPCEKDKCSFSLASLCFCKSSWAFLWETLAAPGSCDLSKLSASD